MLDNINPTSQFHPYTPATATPHSELPKSGVKQALRKLGIDSDNLDSWTDGLREFNWKESLQKARSFATSKPGLALGGLAVAVIGFGLLRRRA